MVAGMFYNVTMLFLSLTPCGHLQLHGGHFYRSIRKEEGPQRRLRTPILGPPSSKI
jgi:hypothetical protein